MIVVIQARKRNWIWIGIAVVVLALVLWMNWRADAARDLAGPRRARADGRPIPVRLGEVGRQEVEEVVGATGLSTPSSTVEIQLGSSRGLAVGDLVLEAIHVWEGKEVSRGDLLFEIDDELFSQTVVAAEAEFTLAETELDRALQALALNEQIRELTVASAEAEVEFRTEDLARREKNHEGFQELQEEGYLSPIDLAAAHSQMFDARFLKAQAERTLERATVELSVGLVLDQERVAGARGRVATGIKALEVARRDLERCRITSPIDGFADEVFGVPGQILGDRTQLTAIHVVDPMHVRVDYPPERAEILSLGQSVEVVFDNLPQMTFEGRVLRIAPNVDPKTRVLPVVVELDNPDRTMRAGIGCFVRFRLRRSATAVPAVSVIKRASRALVFVVEDGTARIREIRTGPLLEPGYLEVYAGLEVGEDVVLYGNFDLRNGDRVDASWRQWARRE